MSNEKKVGNYSYFSEELIEKLENSNKAFLLFNRKGEFKQYICNNCGHIIKLDNHKTKCPNCGSLDFKKSIFGIKKILTDLENKLPNKKIIEITKDEIPENIDQADIVIGTDYALNQINISQINLICIITIDHELAIPQFDSSEKVFQKLINIINLNLPTIIQTHSPDHLAIKSAATLNFKNFYKTEEKMREKLHYPPFGELIKIINKKTKEEKFIKDTDDLEQIQNSDNYLIDRM